MELSSPHVSCGEYWGGTVLSFGWVEFKFAKIWTVGSVLLNTCSWHVLSQPFPNFPMFPSYFIIIGVRSRDTSQKQRMSTCSFHTFSWKKVSWLSQILNKESHQLARIKTKSTYSYREKQLNNKVTAIPSVETAYGQKVRQVQEKKLLKLVRDTKAGMSWITAAIIWQGKVHGMNCHNRKNAVITLVPW